MKKSELEKIWKLIDGACDALERMTYDNETFEILERHENNVDFSSIVCLKNDVEELIGQKSRKKNSDLSTKSLK